MEIKSLSYLNSKAWYRTLKVLYVCFAIFCFGLAVLSSISVGIKLNEDRQEYLKEQDTTNKQIKEIKDLKEAGFNTKEISDKVIKRMTSYSPYVFKEIYGESESSKLDLDLYDKNHQKPASLLWLLLYAPFSLALAWFFLQVPKWIFYYIYIGKIKPAK